MGRTAQYLFNAFIAALLIAGQYYIYTAFRSRVQAKLARIAGAVLMVASLVVVWLNGEGIFWQPATSLSRGVSYGAAIWVVGCAGAAVIFLFAALVRKKAVRRTAGPLGPSRREFLSSAARATALLTPFGLAGYGTLLVRSNFTLRESSFPVAALPPELHGLRIALLSDIHFGPYLSLPELDRVIAMANETRPHLTLITGDLITRVGDPLETCLRRLRDLKADAGIFGCMGNHEEYAHCQRLTERLGRTLGMEFLRQSNRTLEFGGARLNLAGVDYQRKYKPYLVGAQRLLEPGAVNLLLSHNPDVFPVAANLGYDLVVGGHTHGGQVTVEIVDQRLNVGRFFTPFVAGLYRRGASSLYVSRGIGTINLPMRLGARPEVSLLVLRQA